MKFYLKLLLTFALLAGVSSPAFAQSKQERTAGGNTGSVSATSRVDAINKRLDVFISTQSATFSGTATNIQQTNQNFITRIGTLTSMLGNVGTTASCDPNTGMHGCKPQCACSVNGKILWTGNKWQCYNAQYQCPQGQSYDSATCKCKTTTGSCNAQTPPQACEDGKEWDPTTCTCCSGCVSGQCPPGMRSISVQVQGACGLAEPCMCADYVQVPNPSAPPSSIAMIDPRLEPYANIVSGDSGCRRVASCKFGMDLRRGGNGPNCCCPFGKRFKNGQCGDICPSGYSAIYLGHSDGPVSVCSKNNDAYYTVGESTCPAPDAKAEGTHCGGSSLTCCERRAYATDFANGLICAPSDTPTH